VLFSDWTPRDLAPHVENVEVYSNCDEVELFVNGRSLGSKPRPADARPRNWAVDFLPGSLRAVGRTAGQEVAEHELQTAGDAAQLSLAADRDELAPGWDHLAFVEVTIIDEAGVPVPRAGDAVTFSIHGPGQIVAVDNGSIISHEPFQAHERRAFQGRCVVAVRATQPHGTIVIGAAAAGLAPSSVEIQAGPPPLQEQ
jgi:beta-galactosidase